MNNREITEKKNEEKNFENSLQKHDKLKSYLINICVKIEKGFDIIYYPHERESSSVANLSYKGMIIIHLFLTMTLTVFGVFTLIYWLKPKKNTI